MDPRPPPRLLGAVVLLVILALVGGVLLIDGGVLSRRYPVVLAFTDAASVKPGDRVTVAGLPAGRVTAVELTPAGDQVAISVAIDDAVELPHDVDARISLDTVLGTRSVRLELPDDPDWATSLREAGHVPLTDRSGRPRTRTPVELVDVQDLGTDVLDRLDTEELDVLLRKLGGGAEDARDDLVQVADGFTTLFGRINERETEVRSLLRSGGRVIEVLADREEQLLAALDDLAHVAETLDQHRDQVVGLLRAAVAAAEGLTDLVGDNRSLLDSTLADLQVVLDVIDRHQIDIAHILASAASGIEGFASITYAGSTPVPWGGAATLGFGPLSSYGLNACGPLDRALDLMLGEDPVPCAERDVPFLERATPEPGSDDAREDRP